MNSRNENNIAESRSVVKRRGLLRFGTLLTAFTGISAVSALGANVANAAPGDKNSPTTYIPIAEKGTQSGVATLDTESKIPRVQLPDLSNVYEPHDVDGRRAVRKDELFIRAEDYGTFQLALDAASALKKDLIFSSRWNLSSGVCWDAFTHSIIGKGQAELNFSGMTTGAAVTVRGRSGYKAGDAERSSGLEFMTTLHSATGFKVTGSLNQSYTADGFVISDPLNISFISFEHVFVQGFRDQFVLQDKSWCITWTKCFLRQACRHALNIEAVIDAGENYNFFGGAIADVRNAAGDASAVYSTPGSNADIYFHSTSFDYNDYAFDYNSGVIGFHGCHIEGNREIPFGKVSHTPGQELTTCQFIGGTLAATELSTVRLSLIDCVSGDQIMVSLDGVKLNTLSKAFEIVRVLSGNPVVTLRGLHMATAVRPSGAANRLYNGSFDTGNTDGWTKTAVAGTTHTAQTAIKRSGTHALAINGIGTAGTSTITQRFPVSTGQQVLAEVSVARTAMTAGNAYVQARFLAADGAALLGTSNVATVSSASPAAFTMATAKGTAPKGASLVDITVRTTDLNGTIFVDDFVVNII